MKSWSANKKRVLGLLSAAALTLLALVGGLVYFVTSPDFEEFAEDYVVSWIERRSGASVTLEAFDADFQRMRFFLDQLVLEGEEGPAAQPLLSIDRVEIELSWMGLLRRSLDLTRLAIINPTLFLVIGEDGTTNVPTPPVATEGGAPAFRFSIDEFSVSGGSLVVDERRIDADFDLASLAGEFAYANTTGVLSGHLEYEGTFARSTRILIPYDLSMDFDYSQSTLIVDAADLQSGTSALRLQGRVDDVLSTRQGQLAFTGSADLEFLNHFFPRDDLEGVVDLAGDMQFSTDDFRASGRANADRARLGRWTAGSLDSSFRYAWSDRTLVAEGLRANLLGGSATGTVQVALGGPPPRRVDLSMEYENVDAAALAPMYPWGERFVIASRSEGTLNGWFEGRFDRFELTGDAMFEPSDMPAGPEMVALRVRGATGYLARRGSVEVTGLTASIGSTQIRANGLIDREASELQFAVESGDFQDLAFLSDLANGAGEIGGVLQGPIAEPEFSGRFSVVDYSYRDWEIDRLEGQTVWTPDQIQIHDIRVIHGDSDLLVSGRLDRDLSDPDLEIDVLTLAGSDLRTLLVRPVDGTVSGAIRLRSLDPLRFDADLESADFSYNAHLMGSVEARISFDPGAWNLTEFVVRRGEESLGGNLRFEPATRTLVGRVTADGYPIDDLRWAGLASDLTGTIQSAEFEVDGSLDAPLLEGRAVLEDFELRGFSFPQLDLRVSSEGGRTRAEVQAGRRFAMSAVIDPSLDNGFPMQGTAQLEDFAIDPVPGLSDASVRLSAGVSFEGQLRALRSVEGVGEVTGLSARLADRTLEVVDPFTLRFDGDRVQLSTVVLREGASSLTLEGTLEVSGQAAADDYPFQVSASFVDFAAGDMAGLSTDALEVTGSAFFESRLRDLAASRGSGEVTGFTARMGERTLRVSEPFTVAFDVDGIQVSSVRFEENATSLELEGTLAVTPEAPLDLSVQGALDLSLLAGVYAGLDTQGGIALEGRVTGSLANPDWQGVATLDDVSISHENLFLSLSSLSGNLFFEDDQVNLTGIRGSAGGGDVALEGSFSVEGARPDDLDIRMDLANVRVRTPEGVRTVFGGGLALVGTADAPILEGNIQVADFTYGGGFDTFLTLFDRGVGGVPAGQPLDRLGLAVHVEGDRNIRVENDVGRVEARLELDLAGTFGDPTMTGRIESTSGNLNFQGTRYRITRGTVDLVDPLGIEPLIDVQAEADLRNYRIILAISGRGDAIRLDMRSDPPLSQLEIVSLVAGGRTREELAESGAEGGLVPTDEQLFTGGAATILTDLLQERVGSRLGLLSRVRIDPFLVGAENDPVARVTVSEQITRDLAITYSQDLSSNRQQVILIEYFLSNDTSFLASRDETGALGLDIRLRKRFR